MRYNTLVFLITLFIHPVFSHIDPIHRFNQFSLKDGLSQTTVRSVLRDSDGFLWIGTSLGLNRFDGQVLTTYFKSTNTQNSIPGNYIYYVVEDEQNNIWVSTNDKLALFDKGKQEFVIQHINESHFESYAYHLAPDGMICCSSGALFKYVYESRSWEIMPITTKEPLKFHFTAVKPWDKDHLLLNSRFNGMFLYQLSSGIITEHPFFKKKNIPCIFIDSKKQLWISSYREGLYCYSHTGELLHFYNTHNSKLSNDVILDMIEINGNLWIGTDGGGINILNIESQTFSHINHVFENPNSFPANSVISLYKDNPGSIWVGTVRNGLIEIKDVFMKTFTQVTFNNHYGLSYETVLSLFEDEDEIIWVGTDGGGINKFNPNTGIFEHFTSTMNDKVTSITNYTKDELLISLFDEGVFFFNKKTGQKRRLSVMNEETDSYVSTSGFSTYLYSENTVTKKIISDDIYIYNSDSGFFSKIPFEKEKNSTRRILKTVSSDPEGEYLYTFNKIFKKQSTGYQLLLYQPNNADLMNAVAKDKNGYLWIATGSGIRRFDPSTQNLEEYLSTPSQSIVSSIVCDSGNRLWIGTRDDLWVYYIDEDRFETFNESDGVMPNEYLATATIVTKSGDIYMGGVNGLLFIDKNTVSKSLLTPDIKLIEVSTKDKEIYQFDSTLDGMSVPHIKLPWDESSVTLRVMMQGKDIFRKHNLRYYVSGLYKEPIETSDQSLTLHSLSSGSYTISIAYNLPNGIWSKPSDILKLSIAPPWWKTVWFTLLLVVIILTAIILAFLYFIKKKEDKLEWRLLEREKEVFQEKVRFLINISHELRTPLTLIYAPLKRMLSYPLDNNAHSQISNIYKQATRMKETINMVLDLHKIETGNETLIIKDHNLNDWIRETANLFTTEFNHHNIKVDYNLDERITIVPFDKSKCEIVLSNIFSNALKFSNKDSTIYISTILQKKTNNVRVNISDEGIGLHGVDIEKLFSRFYQGAHQRGGSGIGLSFSKTIIERHGGTMGATNNNGKGATFFFELPLLSPEDIKVRPQASIQEAKNSETTAIPYITNESTQIDTNNYSILLVEDNPELLAFLKMSLKPFFKKVYSCTNGVDALEIVHRNIPDIIVSDVIMPQMDGYDLCRKIKSDIAISHIPIILLTARGDSESMQLGYKLGADAYVSKPFDIDFLHTIIENQLKARETIKIRYQEQSKLLSPQEITISNADERFVIKLNELIEENISNPSLNVNFISSEIGMSRTSLYSKMSELLNTTVNDYINRIKFDKAAALLTSNPTLEISEIALKLGFSSQRYFSSSFKQYYGVTPSEYKKKNLRNECN